MNALNEAISRIGVVPVIKLSNKAMSAPFPQFKVMPTGGISLKNLKEYLSCPVIAACGGPYMVTADLIDGGRWDEITELCRQSRAIVEEVRNG